MLSLYLALHTEANVALHLAAKETIPKLDEIEKRHREEIKLSEEELRILNDGPDDLLQNLETLINVRTAFEADTPRTSNTAKSRTVKRGRAEIDGANDSPAPTPEVSTPGPPSKAVSKQNPSRSASVAATTPIVKIETSVDPGEYKTRRMPGSEKADMRKRPLTSTSWNLELKCSTGTEVWTEKEREFRAKS